MNRRSIVARALVVLLFVVQVVAAQVLRDSDRAKLHPRFIELVESVRPQKGVDAAQMTDLIQSSDEQGNQFFDAIIHTLDARAIRAAGVHTNSDFGRFVTARVAPDQLVSLVGLREVTYIDPGSINTIQADVSVPETGAPLLHSGFLKNTKYTGKGVIVLIYDTGIDFFHGDFRDPNDLNKSRILAIWDQTLTPISGERNPTGLNYGVEYTKAEIDDEIDGTPTGVVRQRDISGHGTHVAGTAAGNGKAVSGKYVGMAPEADIIVVKGGDGSFSESRMIDGLTYAQQKAVQFGKPLVLNWSIGGQHGPHDGTRDYEFAVDQFVNTPGRIVCISAGNDGASNIHIDGTVSTGSSTTITFTVPTYTATSGTNNDRFTLDLWFNTPVNAVIATLTSPGGIVATRTAGQTGSEADNTDGTITVDNYLNNSGLRGVWVDVRDADATRPPKTGTWTLVLSGISATTTYDGWMSRTTVGTTSVTVSGGNTNKTVSSPGTSNNAITVGSYVTKWTWYNNLGSGYTYSNTVDRSSNISDFSAKGPTRDGRLKPEISAPGQGITAALSKDMNPPVSSTRIHLGDKHYLTQGTSMASPHVAGGVALLLQASPTLQAQAIKDLLTSRARKDAFTGTSSNNTWGHGKMDILNSMAANLQSNLTVSRDLLAYDVTSTSAIITMSGAMKLAVRFTPTISGQVTGALVMPTTPVNNPIQGLGPLVCEVYTNVSGSIGGIPGTRIGAAVQHPFSQMSSALYNYVDMTPAGVNVNAGTEYHLVMSPTNPTDTLKMRADDGSVPTDRSSRFDGTWLNFSDPASGITAGRNLRLRVVVSSLSTPLNVTAVDGMPATFELFDNYPNPFNPSTTIRYSIPSQSLVKLKVFDLLGKEIVTLVNEPQNAGTYQVEWNGRDMMGSAVSSGVYFYRLEGSGFAASKKLVLLK
ncbi:MAG: T9SS type A sorting domain-containing protein [Ignavibacteria bacterium]|nr:T9SS type A sorting domain-containing protein [Ignavibacteria bacterium]